MLPSGLNWAPGVTSLFAQVLSFADRDIIINYTNSDADYSGTTKKLPTCSDSYGVKQFVLHAVTFRSNLLLNRYRHSSFKMT